MIRYIKILVIATISVLVLAGSSPIASATAIYYPEIPLSEEAQTYLYNRCVSEGISFDMMLALIEQESNFQKYCVSDTGDYGLCQINVASHVEMIEKKKIVNIYDEFANIDCAMTILYNLFEQYKEQSLVLTAYNIGEDGARRCWDRGKWETDYSVSVYRKMQKYNYDMKIAEMLKT